MTLHTASKLQNYLLLNTDSTCNCRQLKCNYKTVYMVTGNIYMYINTLYIYTYIWVHIQMLSLVNLKNTIKL